MSADPGAPDSTPASGDNLIEPRRFRPPGVSTGVPRLHVPWLRIGAFLLLVVVAWAAWFVLAARSVSLVTEPADSRIEIHAWPAPRMGEHWLLARGERSVTVSAPGYNTYRGDITVGDEPVQTHTIKLTPLPGALNITLSPVEAAEVLIDGEQVGTAPGLIKAVEAGSRRIRVSAPRYLPFTTDLVVEGKGIEQSLEVTLEPAWADISIDSIPEGAEVLVDKEVQGQTPLTLELLAGRRTITLQLNGYKRWQQTITVTAGNNASLGEVVLSKADGGLNISSQPAQVNVTVNGEFQGRTPLKLKLKPDKTHTIGVSKPGYLSREQKLSLSSGENKTLEFKLEAELATIHLQTTPADAELLINGETRGNATQTLSLPTHEHEITVRRAGYATYQTTVTPRKGVEKRFKIRLKKASANAPAGTSSKSSPEKRRPPATRSGAGKGFITTHAGQTLKLFTGGRATLGAPRRDSARRANEAVRQVQLERPFYLALKEVSNAEFRLFLATHNSGAEKGNSLNEDTQPVVGLNWEAAALYCNWLSRRDSLPPFYQIKFGEVLGVNPAATGYRLPTEAEWEWVARFSPTGDSSRFPWGEKFPPRGRSGNYGDSIASGVIQSTLASYNDGFAVAAPVGSFAANLNGIYDMDGNVAEWVHDYYNAAPSPELIVDPLGPPTGAEHVIKGGSWRSASPTELRLSYRDSSTTARNNVGFRLARYAQ